MCVYIYIYIQHICVGSGLLSWRRGQGLRLRAAAKHLKGRRVGSRMDNSNSTKTTNNNDSNSNTIKPSDDNLHIVVILILEEGGSRMDNTSD